MKSVYQLLILLTIAVGLGVLISYEPGYVLIAFDAWSIEMTAWAFLVILAVIYCLLRISYRLLASFFALPSNWRAWLGQRRRQQHQVFSQAGLINLLMGDWHKAQHYFDKTLQSNPTLINTLGAAVAAHEEGHNEKAHQYLQQARVVNPEADVAITLTEAKLLLAEQKLGIAEQRLERLRDVAGDNPQLLSLLKTIYVESQNWAALQLLLPALKKRQVINEFEYRALLEQTHQAMITRLDNYEALRAYWKKVPSELKSESMVLQIYTCKLLAYSAAQQTVEKILRQALNARWNVGLIENYAKITGPTLDKALSHAEKWFQEDPLRPALALALASMCLVQKLWGKGQYYLEYCLDKEPNARAYYLLATVHEQLGNKAASERCWKAGLALAVG